MPPCGKLIFREAGTGRCSLDTRGGVTLFLAVEEENSQWVFVVDKRLILMWVHPSSSTVLAAVIVSDWSTVASPERCGDVNFAVDVLRWNLCSKEILL